MRLTPGTRVGPYEVLSSLGSGGMAEVYRARDTRLQREVAVKVVGEALAGDTGFFARLEQEARLAGSLNHPNIVAVHDVGVHEGAPYVVTELLQGETLRERLGRGPVPLSQALEWGGQMAHALAAANGLGIVHRDMKPENIFITRTGQLKLLDFGIAKATPRVTEPRGLLDPTMSPSGSPTHTGAVLGTPGYMSPEQVQGQPVDARSDIFALGAILYEVLSGQRAFRTGTLVESGYAILHDEPLPLPASVPSGVAQVVQRCLAKDPEQRFQSARDVAFSLEALRGHSGATPALPFDGTRVRPGRYLRRALWLGAAVLLGLAAFGVGRASRVPAAQPGIRQLTFRRGAVWTARFAPDGKTVHFSAAFNGGLPELYTTSVDSPVVRPLGLGEAQLLSVSPSGEMAVLLHPRYDYSFGLRGTLATVSPLGGTPRQVATEVFYADWAPDGLKLAVVRSGTEGNSVEFPLGRVVFKSPGFISDLRVAPSGERVAFIDHQFPGDSAGTVTVVNAGGEAETWGPRFEDAFGVAWSHTANEVLVGAAGPGELAAIWAIGRSKSPRLVYRGTGNLRVSDVGRDGRLLVTERDWRQELVVIHGNASPRSVEWLDWASASGLSDDGKEVLSFESGVGASPNMLVVLRNLDQAEPVQLGQGRAIALSTDGQWALVVPSDAGGALRLLPTGPGESRSLLVPGLERIYSGAFFRDGKRLALMARTTTDQETRVYLYDMGSGQLRPLSPALPSNYRVAVSEDQRWVAAGGVDGVPTAFSVEGAEPIRATELGSEAVVAGWLKDGTLLTYARDALPTPVSRFNPRTREVTPFATLAPADLTGVPRLTKVYVTPDGQTFAFHYRRRMDVLYLFDFGEHPP